MTVVVVTIGAGALGAAARYLVSLAFAGRSGFPWAVLVVNVVGAAIGGVVVGLAVSGGLSSDSRFILISGLCGGLTTFSTFSVESIQLIERGKWHLAVLSVVANLVLGLAAAAAGYLIATLA